MCACVCNELSCILCYRFPPYNYFIIMIMFVCACMNVCMCVAQLYFMLQVRTLKLFHYYVCVYMHECVHVCVMRSAVFYATGLHLKIVSLLCLCVHECMNACMCVCNALSCILCYSFAPYSYFIIIIMLTYPQGPATAVFCCCWGIPAPLPHASFSAWHTIILLWIWLICIGFLQTKQ